MKAQGYSKETIRNIGIDDRGFPPFNVGDTIAVGQRIKEAGKERIQVFQGDVIAAHHHGNSSTFTVRKIGAHGIPVERIFPYYAPLIKEIKVIKKGDVKRAKLYYIRDRVGKAARLKEKIITREQREQQAAAKGENTSAVHEPVKETTEAPEKTKTD